MPTTAPKSLDEDQYQILVDVRPGSGQAKFFADVEFRFANGQRIKIPGFPVWNGKDGELRPDLPTKPGTTKPSTRYPVVEFDPATWGEIYRRILVACEIHQRGNQGK